MIFGTDEVGRGSLFGDVMACTVKVKSEEDLENLGIHDSKKISEKKRKKILEDLGIHLEDIELNKDYDFGIFSFAISNATPQEIDSMNILQATFKCMNDSFRLLVGKEIEYTWLVDGDKPPCDDVNIETVIKGDSKFLSIGLASIIAKEYRDYTIIKIADKYPNYGLEKHKGYGTKLHRSMILKHGASVLHRKTFIRNIK